MPHHKDTQPQRHSSPRLVGYDYQRPGAYFITICTLHRQPLFVDSWLRKLLQDEWRYLPYRFPAVSLDTFVIMPDHLHGILWLSANRPERPDVSSIIGAYKSIVNKHWTQHIREQANPLDDIDIWQRSFYDTIIKNKQHLIRTRLYIINNPLIALKEQEKHHRGKG